MSSQEELWVGKFGDEYHKRNRMVDRKNFWLYALQHIQQSEVRSVLEVGAGQGDNLKAIDWYLSLKTSPHGIEVNKKACKHITDAGYRAVNSTALKADLKTKFDLVVTRGFLMHVPDEDLTATLDRIYNWSKRYIVIAEYYSPVRREVEYHGHSEALWIDDFAGKMLERYPDLTLITYAFKYHRAGFGDETYFVMEKVK